MKENQVLMATELMKGKVATPCISNGKVCPLLDINEGCTAEGGLSMGKTGVECPEGKGTLIISSDNIRLIEIPQAQELALV